MHKYSKEVVLFMLERVVSLQNMKDLLLASLNTFDPYSPNLEYTYQYEEQ